MSLTIAILSTAFLCGTTMLLAKICRMRAEAEHPQPEYLFITKDHYENLQRALKSELIIEQPQPPDYNEKAPLLLDEPNSI